MKYEQKSFTVPASSPNAPKDCRHDWIDEKGKCVLCGEPNAANRATKRAAGRHETSMIPDRG